MTDQDFTEDDVKRTMEWLGDNGYFPDTSRIRFLMKHGLRHPPNPKTVREELAEMIYNADPAVTSNHDHPDYGKPVPWMQFWNREAWLERADAILARFNVTRKEQP